MARFVDCLVDRLGLLVPVSQRQRLRGLRGDEIEAIGVLHRRSDFVLIGLVATEQTVRQLDELLLRATKSHLRLGCVFLIRLDFHGLALPFHHVDRLLLLPEARS